mgnify:CR=1 FL=1|tara:strand:+ start:9176 stop:9427 length:252 start_codon:yes stop_codon:yes gene_type:complete
METRRYIQQKFNKQNDVTINSDYSVSVENDCAKSLGNIVLRLNASRIILSKDRDHWQGLSKEQTKKIKILEKQIEVLSKRCIM